MLPIFRIDPDDPQPSLTAREIAKVHRFFIMRRVKGGCRFFLLLADRKVPGKVYIASLIQPWRWRELINDAPFW